MKKITHFLSVALLLSLLTSFTFSSKTINSIKWTSMSYVDLKSRATVQMLNEFSCTPQGVYWSLFGMDMPVSEVKWAPGTDLKGTLLYRIDGQGMTGTIVFDMLRKVAEVELQTEVGALHYQLTMDSLQDISE